MIMMKKNIFCKTAIFFVLASVFSCSQDPIFFKISTEPKPVKPHIQGSPTNIVMFERNSVPVMYVASGNLHWYAKANSGTGASGWDSAEYGIPQPGGKVIGLAATDEYLYALSIIDSGAATALRRIEPDKNEWENIPIAADIKYTLIQTIFADKDRLFAGARNNSGSDFGILYLVGGTLELLEENTEMLSGAASRLETSGTFHYLSTRKGVYKVAAGASSAEQLKELVQKTDEDGNVYDEQTEINRLFMGMIQLEDHDKTIIMIERNGGTLFEVREDGFKQIRYSDGANVASGRFSTGALALWRQTILDEDGQATANTYKRLVAGIQGGLYSTTTSSSYTHGYVEFELSSDNGSLVLDGPRNINPDITVDGNTDRYTATIGKHPINHFFQAPESIDKNMIFFASTQTAGLWSYRRDREGGPQWNAEK